MMKTCFVALFACFALLAVKSYGQDTIYLNNPSFEGLPGRCCEVPPGWTDPGVFKEPPADIQPGSFGCQVPPFDGDTYVSMVVRDNNSWGSIRQNLDGILRKDSAYAFTVYLNQSHSFTSYSQKNDSLVNYKAAAILRIWGFNRQKNALELLEETGPVFCTEWVKHPLILKPKLFDCDALLLEAYYTSDISPRPYNGNLLIDNCSAIVKIKNN